MLEYRIFKRFYYSRKEKNGGFIIRGNIIKKTPCIAYLKQKFFFKKMEDRKVKLILPGELAPVER
jgi:hypothetical protein